MLPAKTEVSSHLRTQLWNGFWKSGQGDEYQHLRSDFGLQWSTYNLWMAMHCNQWFGCVFLDRPPKITHTARTYMMATGRWQRKGTLRSDFAVDWRLIREARNQRRVEAAHENHLRQTWSYGVKSFPTKSRLRNTSFSTILLHIEIKPRNRYRFLKYEIVTSNNEASVLRY